MTDSTEQVVCAVYTFLQKENLKSAALKLQNFCNNRLTEVEDFKGLIKGCLKPKNETGAKNTKLTSVGNVESKKTVSPATAKSSSKESTEGNLTSMCDASKTKNPLPKNVPVTKKTAACKVTPTEKDPLSFVSDETSDDEDSPSEDSDVEPTDTGSTVHQLPSKTKAPLNAKENKVGKTAKLSATGNKDTMGTSVLKQTESARKSITKNNSFSDNSSSDSSESSDEESDSEKPLPTVGCSAGSGLVGVAKALVGKFQSRKGAHEQKESKKKEYVESKETSSEDSDSSDSDVDSPLINGPQKGGNKAPVKDIEMRTTPSKAVKTTPVAVATTKLPSKVVPPLTKKAPKDASDNDSSSSGSSEDESETSPPSTGVKPGCAGKATGLVTTPFVKGKAVGDVSQKGKATTSTVVPATSVRPKADAKKVSGKAAATKNSSSSDSDDSDDSDSSSDNSSSGEQSEPVSKVPPTAKGKATPLTAPVGGVKAKTTSKNEEVTVVVTPGKKSKTPESSVVMPNKVGGKVGATAARSQTPTAASKQRLSVGDVSVGGSAAKTTVGAELKKTPIQTPKKSLFKAHSSDSETSSSDSSDEEQQTLANKSKSEKKSEPVLVSAVGGNKRKKSAVENESTVDATASPLKKTKKEQVVAKPIEEPCYEGMSVDNSQDTLKTPNSSDVDTNRSFRRVSTDMNNVPEQLRDNKFKPSTKNEYGVKASQSFQNVKGRQFKHEKTKKKRGSFGGVGMINSEPRSYKFSEE